MSGLKGLKVNDVSLGKYYTIMSDPYTVDYKSRLVHVTIMDSEGNLRSCALSHLQVIQEEVE